MGEPSALHPASSRATARGAGCRRCGLATLVLAGAALSAAIVSLARRILRIEERPAGAPDRAVSAGGAREAVRRFVASNALAREAGIDFAPSTATSIDPFVEGSEFYPQMLADLEQASTIHILMFGWKPGTWGDRFAETIAERLAAGAEVRIVVDSFGSRPYGLSRSMFTRLVEAGAEVVVNDLLPPVRHGSYPTASAAWSRWDIGRSDHRKLLVLDGRVMWTGGAGIEDHFENGEFHDVMVRLTGDVVRQAQAVFAMAFVGNGAAPESVDDWFVTADDDGSIPVTIGQVVPGGCVTATQAARDLIDTATRRLDIVNPYLTDAGMIDRLVDAARRDVRVRVVVSARSNNMLASAALRHRSAAMLDAGIEIWHYPDAVVHAKVIAADDAVQFGTLNLDAWALYRNFELAVVARDTATTERLVEALVDPAIARSTRVEAPSRGLAAVAEALAARMSYVL